jgi:predicted AlkP superfamily phosphohydrolase/phosphomutase
LAGIRPIIPRASRTGVEALGAGFGYARPVPGRTLLSAAVAASIGAASLATLALYLNPGLVLRAEAVALLLCLFLPWAVGGTLALALLAAAASAVRWWPRPYRPVIAGRPFFASLAFVALGFVAALYWHNLLSYRHALPAEALRALTLSAAVVTGAVALLLLIGLDRLLQPRRERPLAAALAVLAPAAALAVPLALRPDPVPHAPPVPVRLDAARPTRRIAVVGIDGLGPGDLEAEGGAAPALARLARRGAFGPLATLRPTEGPPLWTTIVTGRLPRDHGVLSATTYRLVGSPSEWRLLPKGALIGLVERIGLATRRPVASAARERRAIWNVLDAFGIPSGLVNVWGTQPPEAIHGFVVSPYFHLLSRDPARAAATLHPGDLLAEVVARAVRAEDLDPALLYDFVDAPRAGASALDDPRLRELAERSLAPDMTYRRVAEVLSPAYRPSLEILAFHGYDAAGHTFYRYAHPEAFGDVRPDAARRYGHVLERYASLLGRWIGEIEKELGPDDVLVVVSAHGLEPTRLWRRLVGTLTGTEVAAASHAAAPPGLLLAVGAGIQPGAGLVGASVLDVTPTLLYLLGLPVARDMEGRVLTEMLDPVYARDHPVTFIPSYEGLAVAPAVPGAPVDELPLLPEEKP